MKIKVATIVGVKGIKGELKAKVFAEDLNSVFDLKLFDDDNINYVVKDFYMHKDTCILSIEGVANRNSAEDLIGTNLYIMRADLPSISNGDEYYIVDLIGVKVLDKSKKCVGTVVSVDNYGSLDILSIKFDFLDEIKMIEFTKENVLEVNLSLGREGAAAEGFEPHIVIDENMAI